MDGMNGSRLKAVVQKDGVRVGVEVIQSLDGVANKGDVCNYCILDALAQLDKRPKVAVAKRA